MTVSWAQGSRPFVIADLLEETCLDQDQVYTSVLQALANRWRHAAGTGAVPNRQAFQPETLHDAIGRLMIMQVEGEAEPQFRYRLFGVDICSFIGLDLTGQTTEAVPCDALRRRVWAHNRQAQQERRPFFHRLRITDGNIVVPYEKVILPVTADGGSDQLLVCAFPIS